MNKDILEGNLYFNIHQWIKRNYGRAKKCDNPNCKSINPKRYEWALKKGCSYEKDIKNYTQLCVSCHRTYDFTESKRANMSKAKLDGTANDIPIISINNDGVATEYRSISEAVRLSGVSIQTIYDSLRKIPKKWKRKTTNLTWIYKPGIN